MGAPIFSVLFAVCPGKVSTDGESGATFAGADRQAVAARQVRSGGGVARSDGRGE